VHVVEIFLPLKRNDGSDQPRGLFGDTRRELVDRFGGLTAFTRAPAEGLWEDSDGSVDRDQIVIFEVMADALDRNWWSDFRRRLEIMFEQEAIVIRASAVERL
jgi:hypothetical protein